MNAHKKTIEYSAQEAIKLIASYPREEYLEVANRVLFQMLCDLFPAPDGASPANIEAAVLSVAIAETVKKLTGLAEYVPGTRRSPAPSAPFFTGANWPDPMPPTDLGSPSEKDTGMTRDNTPGDDAITT
ncbi:hypothetical protein Ga0100231_004940 [Opitutaceae bacterium TAV4]|nr:hypothetical protein Ga0100231_004940 [Opitutaceae bacterium TAV4]RRK02341.1 hypothetical protein Ga0100230_004085 [Opitutaceae bacterium TAV3]